jgi:hypothetical protein
LDCDNARDKIMIYRKGERNPLRIKMEKDVG